MSRFWRIIGSCRFVSSSVTLREFIVIQGCLSVHTHILNLCTCVCLFACVNVNSKQPCSPLSVFPSTLESHLHQQLPPSAIAVMTSPLQATTPNSSAAVPSQTLTSANPQFTQAQASSGPLGNQAEGSSGMHPVPDQVGFVIGAIQVCSNSRLILHRIKEVLLHHLYKCQLFAACKQYQHQEVPLGWQHRCQRVLAPFPCSSRPITVSNL